MMFTTGSYWWKIRTSQLQNCASGTCSMGCPTQPLGRYVRHAERKKDTFSLMTHSQLLPMQHCQTLLGNVGVQQAE
jgi:hypothetical protein